MVQLKINENEYTLPDTWNEVSFGQFVDMININKDTWTANKKSIKIIAAFSDKPKELEKDMLQLTIEQINDISDTLAWTKSDFVNEAMKVEDKQFLIIDGIKYRIKDDFNSLEAGAVISLEESLKNPNYHYQELALAILLRKTDINGRSEGFDPELFYYILDELKYKINLFDVYKHISFFSNGDRTSIPKSLKGFSVTKI
jgi:hypothetical protein